MEFWEATNLFNRLQVIGIKIMLKQEFTKGEIVIYKSPQGPEVQVKLEKETEDSVNSLNHGEGK